MQKTGQSDPVSYLTCLDGSKRAYLHHEGNKNVPGVVFLAGHGSDMFGTKAVTIHQMARDQDIPFLRFDYFGHGLSDGDFLEGTISQWVDDCVMMLDQLTTGPQILVGSSLGGWLMIKTALERRKRVAGLVGISAAPDFTETLIWDGLNSQQKLQMQIDGQIALPNPYTTEDVVYPYHLVLDGRNNLVLDKSIELDIPLILFQGMADHEVPWRTAIKIAEKWGGEQVEIILDKQAGHRFSEDHQLQQICAATLRLHRANAAGSRS